MGSGKARLGPKLTILLKCFQALPSDSFFYCSKLKIFKQSLATFRIGKNCKQKLEHKASQSP
jgi:hypothetical protein